MSANKTTISKAKSYQEIGEFWDTHDLDEFWDQTEEVEFAVDIQSKATYYAVDSRLSQRLRELAKQRGVSAETLLNLWIQEKASEEVSAV